MCGICGIFEPGRETAIDPTRVRAMSDTIRHRGPDDEGCYTAPGIGLGFRRLSIIDVKGGHQPLSNEDGTVWIAFNGEIYNFEELTGATSRAGTVSRPGATRRRLFISMRSWARSALRSSAGCSPLLCGTDA